jgi:hypothetical protein
MKATPTNLPVTAHASVPSETRRAFLSSCIRYPILAGLAVLGGTLALRQGDPNYAEPCLKQRVCRDCGLFHDCAKPQAQATRKGKS